MPDTRGYGERRYMLKFPVINLFSIYCAVLACGNLFCVVTSPAFVHGSSGGIVVGMVYTDDDTYICDDSCTYSNDGMCDEDQVRRSLRQLSSRHASAREIVRTV